MNRTRYCYFAAGNADFFRAVGNAEGQHLQAFFSGPEWELSPDLLRGIPGAIHTRGPQNFGFGTALAVVGIFVATRFAGKMFDEVYARTLKRPIARFLDSIFRSEARDVSTPIQFQDAVVFEDIKVVVVIQAVIQRDDIHSTVSVLPEAWTSAHDYIERHGVKAPVHLHKIAAGKVCHQPELLDTLDQLMATGNTNAPQDKKDI